MLRSISVLVFVFISTSTLAQDCSLKFSGKVIDYHDGKPIEGANIFIETNNKYAVTNSKGYFEIENLCKGTIKFSISHVGCETISEEINLTKNTFQDFYLEHHIEEIDDVEISVQTNKQTSLLQESVVKKAQIEDNSSKSLGDVIDKVAGVSKITTGSKIVKPVINGLHSSRVLIVNNGVRQEDQEWGIEHAPNIDVNMANSISVIKGAGALQFGGDAIGGVITLKPVNYSKVDSLFGKIILGYQHNGRGYNISTKLNKTFASGWYTSGLLSYKRNGDLKAPDYYLTNTGMKSFSAMLQGGFKSFKKGFEIYANVIDNEIGILSASHIGNVEDFVNAVNNGEPLIAEDFSYDINAPKQEVNHKLIKASGYYRFKSLGKLNVQYDYQVNNRFEYDRRRGENRDVPAVDLKLQTHSIASHLKVDRFDDLKSTIGLSGRYQTNFANPETGVRRLIPDYDKFDFGFYFINEYKANDNLQLDLGVRYDFNRIDAQKYYLTSRWEERGYDVAFPQFEVQNIGTQILTNPVFDFHNISVSAGVKYDLDSKSTIGFNFSLASRPPNPSELFSDGLHHSAARIELGDLRLNKEVANRFAVNYQLKTDGVRLASEAYINSINNFIYLQPVGTETTIRGAFPVWEYLQTNALLMGVDVNLGFDITDKISFDNTTSYVYGNDQTDDRPLIDIPAFRTVNALTYKNEAWSNFKMSVQHTFVGEQKRYPNNNFETFIATQNAYALVDISTPPKDYQLVNVTSSIDVALSNKTTLNIGAGIENVFNTNYREYLNRLRYFADDTGRNIFLQLKLNY